MFQHRQARFREVNKPTNLYPNRSLLIHGPINGAHPSGCIDWEHLCPGVLANARTLRLLSGDTFGVLPCGLVDIQIKTRLSFFAILNTLPSGA